MRILLTGLTALTLAGCQSPAPADTTPQPNEAVVVGELQNEQMNEAIAIENDAAADNRDVAVDNLTVTKETDD
jgi:hypothetical protein